ncbi:unnamed protein product [marine sediment metagenome]|uniref:Thiamine pyrophosphate enzyme TPP-binding domain-containing protein n=1 Tax=marine sediment metagenome TaxID=412755 RepID=X0ZG17_9ZZZZ
MTLIYKRPEIITDEPFTYCPGCSHGIIHRLVAESIEELGIQEKTIGVSSIGCSVRCWKFLNIDFVQGASISDIFIGFPIINASLPRGYVEVFWPISVVGANCPPVAPKKALFAKITVIFSPLAAA